MKKIISLFISVCIMLTCCTFAISANAEETKTVTYSVCDGGEFTLSPTQLVVSSTLSDTYENQVGYNDNSSSPTILDATIAAHIAMFGDDFSSYAPLKCSSNASTTSAFGEETSALTYRVNGKIADTNGNWYNMDSAVSNNDDIEFMFYQDTTGYSDVYTRFNEKSVVAKMGDDLSLNLTAQYYDSSYNLVSEAAKNVSVISNSQDIGTTDENGNISIDCSKAGEYVISANGKYSGSEIFAPYCAVKVLNPVDYARFQAKNANSFVYSSTEKFDVSNAVDFLTFIKSGADFSAYKDEFVNSVKDNLTQNSGKLVGAYGEDIGLYGATIQILSSLGYDAKSFNSFNIVNAFESIDLTKEYNPYYYRVAIESASEYSTNSEFVKALCDSFIDTYYVLGSGMKYYGYSCDNTATFITALASQKGEYTDVIADAVNVLDGYKTNNGYFSNATYGTNANADSTALAVMAYSAAGDIINASSAYNMLCENFEVSSGVFGYTDNKTANAYATRDALLALEYYSDCLKECNDNNIHCPSEWVVDKAPTCTENGLKHSFCAVCGEKIYDTINKTGHSVVKTVTRATTSEDGKIEEKCSVCGKVISSEKIAYPKVVSLSKSRLVYTGKAIAKPTVTATGSDGKVIPSSNYSVTYYSRATGKAVSSVSATGYYKVKITFKNNYSGTLYRYFYIAPKTVTISSLYSSKNTVSVKWRADKTVTGYKVVLATRSDMKNAKTYTVKGGSSTKKSIAKLQKGKRYYVKVRSYKIVKCDGKSKYIYSAYTSVKSVICK